MALELLKLHHRMEQHVGNMHSTYARELDRLNHALEQVSLKAEVDGLTLKQKVKDDERSKLQVEISQLEILASGGVPSSRKRR